MRFKLINLCKDHPSEKITTNIKEFKHKYMNAASILTDATNAKQWALWVDADKKIVKYGTNDKWTNDIANLLIEEISDEKNIITFNNSKFQIKK